MADSVIKRRTYGSIAFEHWVSDRILTEDDAKQARRDIARLREDLQREIDEAASAKMMKALSEAEQAIEQAKKDLGDPVAAHTVALQAEARRWEEARRVYFKKLQGEHKRTLKALGQVLREMSEAQRREVLQGAVEAGILRAFDKSMIDHAYMFPDVLQPVLAKMGRTIA